MIYTIKNEKFTAKVNDFAGELISFQDKKNVDYIWTGDEKYWPKHTPFLFPIVSSLKNDTIEIDGKEYNMQKHGFVRNMQWEAVETNESSIVLKLISNEETLAQYPFKFKLLMRHELQENGFKTTFEIYNEDDKPMIFCVGGHPGFCCPLFDGESFSDYELIFEHSENPCAMLCDENSILQGERTQSLLTQNNTVLPLEYSLFDKDAIIFDDVNSRKITLKHKEKGHGIHFEYENLNNIAVWSPPFKNAPFLCIEPWKGLPALANESGKFEDKPDSLMLEKKGVFSVSYTVKIL